MRHEEAAWLIVSERDSKPRIITDRLSDGAIKLYAKRGIRLKPDIMNAAAAKLSVVNAWNLALFIQTI